VVGLLIAACSCLVLIGLGTWQLQRKAWKEGLIAALDAQLARRRPPCRPPQLDWQRGEYRRVTFSATFENAKEALVFAEPFRRAPKPLVEPITCVECSKRGKLVALRR
jgi:surfeit locus 1 family protein